MIPFGPRRGFGGFGGFGGIFGIGFGLLRLAVPVFLVFLLILAAVLLLTLAAFAGTAAAQSPQEIKVSEVEFALNPNTFTVQAGQPVQFTVTNNGKIVHNIKVELPSASIEKTLFDTNLQPGETRTATYTFSQAGQWEIYCPVGKHEDAGMKGTITVLAAAAVLAHLYAAPEAP